MNRKPFLNRGEIQSFKKGLLDPKKQVKLCVHYLDFKIPRENVKDFRKRLACRAVQKFKKFYDDKYDKDLSNFKLFLYLAIDYYNEILIAYEYFY